MSGMKNLEVRSIKPRLVLRNRNVSENTIGAFSGIDGNHALSDG